MALSALALILFAALSAGYAAHDQLKATPGRCSGAPDIDFTESINAYLRAIPDNITVPVNPEKIGVIGFDILSTETTGFSNLWAYKQYHTFCVRNRTLIETVVFADDHLTFSINWKSCTGRRGKLGTKVASGKLRLYFFAAPTPEDPTKVVMYNIEPVSVDEPRLFLEGAPIALRKLVDVIGVVAMPHVELFWRRFNGAILMSLLSDDDKV
ncbi:uncharacterized protein LOC144132806 [Amblyomma americanum]